MAKKKGGSRPPKNPELRGRGKVETLEEIKKRGEAEKGLSFEQKVNKSLTGDSNTVPDKSKINLKNYKEEHQKYVRPEPEKQQGKDKQHHKGKEPDMEKDVD